MKRTLLFLAAVAIGGAATAFFVSNQLNSRHTAELAVQQAAWQQEKAKLQAALENAQASERLGMAIVAPAPAAANPPKLKPAELIARLRALKPTSGPGQSRVVRQAIHDFEELIDAGPAALPAIREFLARNEEIDFASPGQGRGGGGKVPDDFVLPPSLRFGLFDVLKRTGGPEAEKLLAETLGTTGRGVELAWLARALQESAPNKYRDIALAAARDLLARPALANPASPLDQNDRDHLFSVLMMYGDTSYAGAAQAQLVQHDGALDGSALKYLQQSLGPQAVAIAAQTYQNPLLLTNAAAKEPLARLALSFVGADTQANEFYQQAINDPVLTKSHRKNLIEDLNEDGLNFRNLTVGDLPLIQNRIALIEQLAPNATDPVNVAAFKEAYKDLINMRERLTRKATPAP
ncbi:MAG TPA: hypothetical protein VJW76_15175 [Verrucomicrobiae bacterium]|nr:hypothetical protein [Verrucomicrobiae bacterium]